MDRKPMHFRYLPTNLSKQVSEIKANLRLVMNGVVSSSMQKRGLNYKENYGVSLVLLKKISTSIGRNHDLAQILWVEKIRELNILATMVQPVDTFTADLANQWVACISIPEQAEYACLNLFQYLPDAKELAMQWLQSDEELTRFTAYHLLARVARKESSFTLSEIKVILRITLTDLNSETIYLSNGALLCLKRVAVKDKLFAEKVLVEIMGFNLLNCDKKRQIYDELKFEFDYYL